MLKRSPITPAERWEASGRAKAHPLTDRLKLVGTYMVRNDLSGTDKAVLWALIIQRMNGNTGLCFASDRTLATDLGVTPRQISRSKDRLKEHGILHWMTEKTSDGYAVSIFILGPHPDLQTKMSAEKVPLSSKVMQTFLSVGSRTEMSNQTEMSVGGRTEMSVGGRTEMSVGGPTHQTEGFKIEAESQAGLAWQRYWRQRGETGMPRGRDGCFIYNLPTISPPGD